ncbi:Plasmodium vivax Vir protein, putative [Plasmodium vivax]|uniref:Vir protein, putative n=1 Tax=Plasmodium vivax TaxID=5855 RepID=A0A1G4E982_PLAVI|nr:Plasmodium vivax Vir protein, putative [Plasmodium vivax]
MPSGSSSTDFFRLFNGSSKELYSEKFYDAMDKKPEDLQNYDQECKNIIVKNHRDQMIPICKKYLRFLDTSRSWSNLFSEYDVSLLLNYWLYDKISDIYGDKNTEEINFGFGALQRIWDLFPYSPKNDSYYIKCWPDHSKVNHEDWQYRKKLYYYYVDFDVLFRTGIIYDKLCEEIYHKIKEMISVCAYFKEKCETPGTYICPNIFNKCTEKNLKTELKKLRCHDTMEAKSVSNSEGDSSHQPPGLARLPLPADGPRLPEHQSDSYTGESPETTDIKTKVTNSVLGAAPVLLTATALYRVPGFVGSGETEQMV